MYMLYFLVAIKAQIRFHRDTEMSVNSLYLHKLFENQVKISPHHPAIIYENESISYLQLEFLANQLAEWLKQRNIGPGKYAAILVERNDFAYIAMLAILKAGAAYVPLDPECPTDRINYILKDCNVSLLITTNSLYKQHYAIPCAHFLFDQEYDQLINTTSKISTDQPNSFPDNVCYVIYTSGTTGKPKGVEITHRSVCNYVQEAKRIYAITQKDRVYQGFSIGFDASVEEIWPALTAGATLISTNNKAVRAGANLIEFLNHHQVSFFSTVPTLLRILEPPISSLRLLILGGEVCHQDLITRWSRSNLRIINTYGPTEATVVTTYCECHPDKPVTIGQPLSNYEIHVLNEKMQPVNVNETGELCIGGICLSRGYVNRPDLNQTKFFHHPELGNKRLYRTGDLCRILESGDLQFVGRSDNQIKLRGFRIELGEIEGVVMEHDSVRQAVASLWEQSPGVEFLTVYLIPENETNFCLDNLINYLKSRLAAYMLPSFFEIVDSFPLLASGKIDRKKLPPPRSIKKSATKQHKSTRSETEKKVAVIWQKLFNQDDISIDADFFYDLGGHSLLAAVAASSLREHPEFRQVSVIDIYNNSTIEKLAEKLESINVSGINMQTETDTSETNKIKKISSLKYYLSSLAQLAGTLIQFSIISWEVLIVFLIIDYSIHHYSYYSWQCIAALAGLILLLPLILMGLTIGIKWLLLGKVKPGVHRVWGTYYLRWWFVQRIQKTIINFSSLSGSPLINLFCRLMGAKIGRNCHIDTHHIGIFDTLTIGDNSSINQESILNGYIVKNGLLIIGTITIGKRCFVGTRSVLSINTRIEDNGMLEDLSMLPENTVIPKAQHYHGSPAKPMESQQYNRNEKTEIIAVSRWKNIGFGCLHYLGLLLIGMIYIIAFSPGVVLLDYFYQKGHLLSAIMIAAPLASLLFMVIFCFSIVITKKILMNKIAPGSYPLRSGIYVRKWIIDHLLNSPEIEVFAESLFFPPLLRLLGMKIGKNVEIAELPHVTPELVTIHDEGFTATAVIASAPRVNRGYAFFSTVEIGKRTFVGSSAVLPPGAQLGDQCLLGSLTIAPMNDKASNQAWLGSPPLFLPRRQISQAFSEKETFNPPKHLYILRAIIEFFRIILPNTFYFLLLLGFFFSFDFLNTHYSLSKMFLLFPIFEIAILSILTTLAIGLKWMMMGRYRPGMKPLWSSFIWKRDCLEHLHNIFLGRMIYGFLLGTPFLSLIHRLLGAKIGKRVFIDTLGFAEHDLVDIGDDVSLNSNCVLLTHLYEDRIFKMDQLKIGNQCNVGNLSIVIYDTVMGENSSLDNLSLLMKGERLPSNSQWVGIPSQSWIVSPSLKKSTFLQQSLETITK